MADEATVVGLAKGQWSSRCLNCGWTFNGPCRMVDMALRAHVAGTGHDANAWDQDKKLTLRLERDVLGRVVHRPDEPEPESTRRWTLGGRIEGVAPWAKNYTGPAFNDEDEP